MFQNRHTADASYNNFPPSLAYGCDDGDREQDALSEVPVLLFAVLVERADAALVIALCDSQQGLEVGG